MFLSIVGSIVGKYSRTQILLSEWNIYMIFESPNYIKFWFWFEEMCVYLKFIS